MGVSARGHAIISGAARACRPRKSSSGGGFPDSRLDALDDGATEAALAFVGYRILAGRDGALRPLEAHADRAIGARLEQRRLVRLAVAHLHAAAERLAARAREPVPGSGGESLARKERMIVPLYDDERVAADILRGHVPGQVRAAMLPADSEPPALAERVERESLVGAEPLPRGGLDGSGGHREEAGQERAERPLADEADPGAVGLVEHREPRAPRALAHRALLELAERHQRTGELRPRHGMQEIALILGVVGRPVERAALGRGFEARVVPGREMRGAEALRPLERHAELDLAIAQHVGIRRAAGAKIGRASCRERV